MQAIASSTALKTLTAFEACGNGVDDDAAQLIANSPTFSNLIRLDLSWNEIGMIGGYALATSPTLNNLVSLKIEKNYIEQDLESILGTRYPADIYRSSLRL